jgi:hypothetical protein
VSEINPTVSTAPAACRAPDFRSYRPFIAEVDGHRSAPDVVESLAPGRIRASGRTRRTSPPDLSEDRLDGSGEMATFQGSSPWSSRVPGISFSPFFQRVPSRLGTSR